MIEVKNVTSSMAFGYIREELARGRMLSAYINHLPIETGSVFALVPPGVVEDKLYAFKYGGIYPFDSSLIEGNHAWVPIQNDAVPLLADEIHKYLNADKEHCCFFEEPIWELSDPKVKTFDLDYVYLSTGQVYYFFNNGNVDIERIKKAIQVSEDYVFLCALSRPGITVQSNLLPSKEITEEMLRLFARNVFVFFVRAYDGEGYLMWVGEK